MMKNIDGKGKLPGKASHHGHGIFFLVLGRGIEGRFDGFKQLLRGSDDAENGFIEISNFLQLMHPGFHEP